MAKILTPLNLGAFVLSHRVVTVVATQPQGCPSMAGVVTLAAGGLVVHSYRPDPTPLPRVSGQAPDAATEWVRFNDAIRTRGGTSLARVKPSWRESLADVSDADATPTSVGLYVGVTRHAGFDGVELDVSAFPVSQPAKRLLDNVQAVATACGPDRVGVHIGPFNWMSQVDDLKPAAFYDVVLGSLAEMEVAYVHLAGVYTPDRGDLSVSLLGRHLRRTFPGFFVASGTYTPAAAVAAVQSRWTDAVSVSISTWDGASFLDGIRLATSKPRLNGRR